MKIMAVISVATARDHRQEHRPCEHGCEPEEIDGATEKIDCVLLKRGTHFFKNGTPEMGEERLGAQYGQIMKGSELK